MTFEKASFSKVVQVEITLQGIEEKVCAEESDVNKNKLKAIRYRVVKEGLTEEGG